jgi:enoyl-CoA hydratase
MGRIYQSFTRVGELLAPTVAAIEGGAVGAGTNLALATDLRVVADDAILRSGFLAIHLHQGGGHGSLLARSAGREVGSALALFGESVTGRRAVELGLAWSAVPAGSTLDTALALARIPGADPDLSRQVARSTRLQLAVDDLEWQRGLELERAAQMWSLRRRDIG